MSEYQYYEFQAVDRPLTGREMQTLRACSTRATITPTRFVNEYHWGGFKGNSTQWMEKYFDAYVHVANWGTRELMLRLPRRLLPLDVARRYLRPDSHSARLKGEHVILSFATGNDGGGDWDGTDDGSGWLASLLPLRADIAEGDHRALYLVWLRSIQDRCDVSEPAAEPPVPTGLAELTDALRALIDFLHIDEDLVAAAAAGSPPTSSRNSPADLADWIAAMPESEKTALLVRFASEEKVLPRAEVLHGFRAASAEASQPATRSVTDLLDAAEAHRKERRRKEAARVARQRARREREAAAARSRHLDEVARIEPATWCQVDRLIAAKQPARYEQAVALLLDLRDVAARSSRTSEFAERIRALEVEHSRKPSLLGRLRRADLVGGSSTSAATPDSGPHFAPGA